MSEVFAAGLIVAMTPTGLMGRDGDLPWHHPEDLKHFKRSTLGGALVMGRKSFESLGGALPGRANVVVSRAVADAGDEGLERDGARWFGDLARACAWAERQAPGKTWIAGGAAVYGAVLEPLDGNEPRDDLPRPDPLVVTWVPEIDHREGDVFFPYDEFWITRHYEIADEWHGQTPGLRFTVYRLRDDA